MIAGIITLSSPKTYAFSDGSGWAMYPYIVKILYEAYKRYTQLNEMIAYAKGNQDFLRILHAGIDNLDGLIATMPIQDEKLLGDLRTFKEAVNKIENLYGAVPQSKEAGIQLLHDQTVAESIKLMNESKTYAEQQEKNATKIIAESRGASPKGAARINAQVSAEILHTLNQLLKINGQMLKLQSENLAASNKSEKDSVRHFQKIHSDIGSSIQNYQANLNFPRF